MVTNVGRAGKDDTANCVMHVLTYHTPEIDRAATDTKDSTYGLLNFEVARAKKMNRLV